MFSKSNPNSRFRKKSIIDILKSIYIKEDFQNRAINNIKSRIDYNTYESEQILNNLTRQKNTIINSIDKLEDMLMMWKITDDKYDLKLKKLQIDLKEIEDRISNSASIENSKFRTFKNVLDFSKESINVYINWWFQTKKNIFRSLGLDYQLKDRKLAIELYPWFKEIKNFNQGINHKNTRFGLTKNSTSIINTNAEIIGNSCWHTKSDEICTYFLKINRNVIRNILIYNITIKNIPYSNKYLEIYNIFI